MFCAQGSHIDAPGPGPILGLASLKVQKMSVCSEMQNGGGSRACQGRLPARRFQAPQLEPRLPERAYGQLQHKCPALGPLIGSIIWPPRGPILRA